MNSATANADMANWQNEKVLKLARRFHKKCDKSNQYRRANLFVLPDVEDIKQLRDVKELRICMAIDKQAGKHDFKFYPILEVYTGDERRCSIFKLVGQEQPDVIPMEDPDTVPKGGHKVPKKFKDMINDHWSKIDFNLIDDLFVAQPTNQTGGPVPQLERVNCFIFDSEKSNKLVNKALEGLLSVTLYPGVDMNKFADKGSISFTPVLRLESETVSTEFIDQPSIIEFEDKNIYLEYSRPCPPTCGS